MRRRLLALMGAVVIVSTSLSALISAAAWEDSVQASMQIGAGTWETTTTTTEPDPDPDPEFGAVGCRPVDPNSDAECHLTLAWLFWGNGYRVNFGVESAHPDRFEWEAVFDLSKQYLDGSGNPLLSQGVAMFPGLTVPYEWVPGGEWHVVGLVSENVCVASDLSEWPVIRLRGPFEWNRTVGGDRPVVWQTQGFQTDAWTSGFPPVCG